MDGAALAYVGTNLGLFKDGFNVAQIGDAVIVIVRHPDHESERNYVVCPTLWRLFGKSVLADSYSATGVMALVETQQPRPVLP
jgi:hypothetical protein